MFVSSARAGAIVVAMMMALAACGSGDDSAATDPPDSAGPSTEASASPLPDASDLDCASLRADLELIGVVGVQTLAQIRSVEMVESLEAGTLIEYDGALLAEAITRSRVLESYDGGDVGESLDVYSAANQKMMEMVDLDDPPTQEMVDAYVESIGDLAPFLAHQIAIGIAFGNTGCG